MANSALDIAGISAIVNVLASLCVLWIMQVITRDAGFRTGLALLKAAHRASLGALAIVLMANAGVTLAGSADPRVVDLGVQITFLVVVALSAARHSMAASPLTMP